MLVPIDFSSRSAILGIMNPLLGSLLNAGQKNSRFLYYARNLLRFSLPDGFCRKQLDRLLREVPRREAEAIFDRVNYCNRISGPFQLGADDAPFRFTLARGLRNYYMDLYEYVRYFDPDLKLRYRFGDETAVPDRPTIVKARPIDGNNENSVLFNLNKIRHFVFGRDRLEFTDKIDKLVWRGNAKQEHRKRFLERFHDHPRCDVGHAHRKNRNSPWTKGYLNIGDQLKYKFILSLEGNDVASNLKWILSSNSLCFMVRPRFETWFMEGRLVPGKHYVLLRDDYADLDEKMAHYSACPEDARTIIRHAKAYVEPFKDIRRERAISLLVLQKYFERSGQRPPVE